MENYGGSIVSEIHRSGIMSEKGAPESPSPEVEVQGEVRVVIEPVGQSQQVKVYTVDGSMAYSILSRKVVLDAYGVGA